MTNNTYTPHMVVVTPKGIGRIETVKGGGWLAVTIEGERHKFRTSQVSPLVDVTELVYEDDDLEGVEDMHTAMLRFERTFKMHAFETTKTSEIQQQFGCRVRRTKRTKEVALNILELSVVSVDGAAYDEEALDELIDKLTRFIEFSCDVPIFGLETLHPDHMQPAHRSECDFYVIVSKDLAWRKCYVLLLPGNGKGVAPEPQPEPEPPTADPEPVELNADGIPVVRTTAAPQADAGLPAMQRFTQHDVRDMAFVR